MENDKALFDASKELLAAAYEFFEARKASGNSGAVSWVDFENGEVLIFTRGEYKAQLLNNIDPKWDTHFFESKTEEI